MNLSDVLKPIDSILRSHQIRYALIGGYAVAAWGEARATRDVDFLCQLSDSKALVTALSRAGLHFEHRTGDL